ncbi:hypothetical protein TS71_07795 [Mycolicibacterium neoaurum]|nr:hypothetical protein D174_16675 [Mycolicibacterium neoaurum VKM Ac-1815D]AMO06492.1 hypothetical protein MyAD_16365 [Mycolicibacterium neoaurum]AXK75155.1 ABC transporter ATP-binding protein [Mycolicibacterium neoaurum]KJQ51155.1 hypothetical protein TS71_07795 [Mycolicibacterium neoaurum]KUM07940.1 hypothetical protein AVZ31_13535 [Mycolicibacterium neoaurum]
MIESQPHASQVQLRGVQMRYGDDVVVHNLNLTIDGGEFFTLLGPSGCGKTTTLRMVAGFESPSAGEILIGGNNVVGVPPERRPTNTVFQHYALFPHLSVLDNVAYGLRRKGMKPREARKQAGTELERVGLTPHMSRKPGQLSGGQQQRVALARALVNLPKVLLLDEPLGALDLKMRKTLQWELRSIQRDVGITFIYVTHDQEEALTMSDRIAVMRDGHFEQIGTPQDVYARPESSFVASFVGVANQLDAAVVKQTGSITTVRLDIGAEFEVDTRLPVPSSRCRAVLRPEALHVRPVGTPVPNGWLAVDGIAGQAAYLGTGSSLTFDVNNGRTQMTALVAGDTALVPAPGDALQVQWCAKDVHLVPSVEPTQ